MRPRSSAAAGVRGKRALAGFAVFLVATVAIAGLARGHWVPPETIVTQLNNDASLREHAGLRHVRRTGRLLIIRVDGNAWANLPPPQRLALAEAWYRLWRHNVDQGIVAVVSVTDDRPLVNYDASGRARLLEP